MPNRFVDFLVDFLRSLFDMLIDALRATAVDQNSNG